MTIHACLIESVEPWMIWLNVPAACIHWIQHSSAHSTATSINLLNPTSTLPTLLPRVPTVPLCVYHIHIANEDERGESIVPREWRGSFPQDLSSFRIISDGWISVCECQCEAASYHRSCSSWKEASQVRFFKLDNFMLSPSRSTCQTIPIVTHGGLQD